MNKTTLETTYLIGVHTRTSNENHQAAKDIPALWQRFMGEDIASQLPQKIGQDIICAYTEYEGDHSQPYTAVVGYKVPNLDNIPKGLKGITIEGGQYEKFLAKGNLKGEALWEIWNTIWTKDIDRSYQVDFEVYGERAYPIENGEADVYISLK